MTWGVLARWLAASLLVALLPLAGFCLIVAVTAGPADVAHGIASLVSPPGAPDWNG